MNYKIFTALSVLSISLASACGGGGTEKPTPNAAADTGINAVPMKTLDPANMPPGLSGEEVKQPVNAPGISANPTQLPKGATPTPGIPSEKDLKKPFKPGATPTPGIPDQETIRKMLGGRSTNVNLPPPSNGNTMQSNPPMMKSSKKTGGKVQ